MNATIEISPEGQAAIAEMDARNAIELARHTVAAIAPYTHPDPDGEEGDTITEMMVWCACARYGRCGGPLAEVSVGLSSPPQEGDSFPQCPAHNGPWAYNISPADWSALTGGPVFEPDTD